MASTLPLSSLTCHAVAQVSATFGAAWTQVGLTDPASTVPLVQIFGNPAAFNAATMRGLVGVAGFNAGAESVFVTGLNPGAGASSLGQEVPAGQPFELPIFGTGTPPRFWVYGHASNPKVVLTALLSEVV
jgi:hypothetical protein